MTETPAGAAEPSAERAGGLTGARFWLATAGVFAVVFAIATATVGDFGVTWDEPSYRYSQLYSQQWWERLASCRSWSDLEPLFDPQALLYYWPYAHYGINFHPPLAGQLNLLSWNLLGGWMKDIPARRMSSVFEYALTVALLFGFLARRYGGWAGLAAAAALVTMPRVFGDGRIAATDTPGLLLWAATAQAFWSGLKDDRGWGRRALVGILVGLAFVEKMSAMGVLVPLMVWLAFGPLARAIVAPKGKPWLSGLFATVCLALPSAVAFGEILRIKKLLPPPAQTDFAKLQIHSNIPGAILLAPVCVWLLDRLLHAIRKGRLGASTTHPALEIWKALLAFPPAIAWLLNPEWWRETMPRMAHYYMLNSSRQGALPNIQILYFGQIYEYSLPVENAFVLAAITVPVSLLIAAGMGLLWSILGDRVRGDRLPLYFLVHMLALPVLRMFPTPAHDGVRLFLPTFYFLAGFAGWGVRWAGGLLGRVLRVGRNPATAAAFACAIAPAAWGLIAIHPYELSYYNEIIGGPKGAWNRGFELSYWYDAFNPKVIREVNEAMPRGASIDHSSKLSMPPTFLELQSLGELRKDLQIGYREGDPPPFMWLLTQDSKATALTRLLFCMKPYYASTPRQLDGLRVFSIVGPEGVSRAIALELLLDSGGAATPDPVSPLPERWARRVPWLSRLWGAGLIRANRLGINERVLGWAKRDPQGFLKAARAVAAGDIRDKEADAPRLYAEIERWKNTENASVAALVLGARPQALVEAAEIITAKPDALRKVMLRYAFTDPATIGGRLDESQPASRSR